ncbi:MAG: hypothetical protein JW806_06490 [Sedimentisphaerales bacterium]|nr:hypothetical protein [Sedimentisphaerales bacterium]
MKNGYKLIYVSNVFWIAAIIVAIPFVRRFVEISDGDCVTIDAVIAGYEVLPWTIGSFLLLCISWIFFFTGVIQLIRSEQKKEIR